MAAVLCPGGTPLATGDFLKQPYLEKTFKLIAAQVPKVFYRGEIAEALVAAQLHASTPTPTEGAGQITLQDLANYKAVIREPIKVNYRSWTAAVSSQPSSGGGLPWAKCWDWSSASLSATPRRAKAKALADTTHCMQ